jgi:hypothetical protein
LNQGAASLFMECPKSLSALFHQLNHGERNMETNTKKIAVKDPIRPKSAYFRSSKRGHFHNCE